MLDSKPIGEVKIMRNKRMLIVFNVLMLLAGFSVVARAQDTPYRLSDKDVKKLMAQLKKDTGRFRKSLDSSLDRSRLNGTKREDDINTIVKNYEDATERLYSRFKDNKSVGADVEAVLDGAAELDRFMTRRLASERAERDWAAVRDDLRRLADAYNVSWRWW
jgi:predicted nucleotidyltransferase